jgi:hypothetical protein
MSNDQVENWISCGKASRHGATLCGLRPHKARHRRTKEERVETGIQMSNADELAKSLVAVIPDLIRDPEVPELTGFRLSPE